MYEISLPSSLQGGIALLAQTGSAPVYIYIYIYIYVYIYIYIYLVGPGNSLGVSVAFPSLTFPLRFR